MNDLSVKEYVEENQGNNIKIHWLKFSFVVYFIVCGGKYIQKFTF